MFRSSSVGSVTRPSYWICEWEDECSAFAEGARWLYGSECHVKTYRMWIPESISKDDTDSIERYICGHLDDPDAYLKETSDMRGLWPCR